MLLRLPANWKARASRSPGDIVFGGGVGELGWIRQSTKPPTIDRSILSVYCLSRGLFVSRMERRNSDRQERLAENTERLYHVN